MQDQSYTKYLLNLIEANLALRVRNLISDSLSPTSASLITLPPVTFSILLSLISIDLLTVESLVVCSMEISSIAFQMEL